MEATLIIAGFLLLLIAVLWFELGERGAWTHDDRLRLSQTEAEERLYPWAGPYRKAGPASRERLP